MIAMHGLFDLREGVREEDFRKAFDAFSEHLEDRNLAVGGRFMCRHPHAGYDARPPMTQHYVAIEFSNMAQAESCWSYVELDDEPLRSLHRKVNAKVRNTTFFLCSDV